MGYYAASSGNFLPNFRYQQFLTFEDVTDMLPLNVGEELPLLAA